MLLNLIYFNFRQKEHFNFLVTAKYCEIKILPNLLKRLINKLLDSEVKDDFRKSYKKKTDYTLKFPISFTSIAQCPAIDSRAQTATTQAHGKTFYTVTVKVLA